MTKNEEFEGVMYPIQKYLTNNPKEIDLFVG